MKPTQPPMIEGLTPDEVTHADTSDIAMSIAADLLLALRDRPWVTWERVLDTLQGFGPEDPWINELANTAAYEDGREDLIREQS